MTRIHQHNASLMAQSFRTLRYAEIVNRLGDLVKAFEAFTGQHTLMMSLCGQTQRAEQERVFAEIDRIYSKVTQGYRRRIDSLRLDRQLQQQQCSLDFETFCPPVEATTTTTGTAGAATTTRSVESPHTTVRADDNTNTKMRPKERSRSPVLIGERGSVDDLRYRLAANAPRRRDRIPRTNTHTNRMACNYCQEPHPMFLCKAFIALPLNLRWSEVKELGLCFNCFMPNIPTHRCRKASHCRKCGQGKFHNSLLCPAGYFWYK